MTHCHQRPDKDLDFVEPKGFDIADEKLRHGLVGPHQCPESSHLEKDCKLGYPEHMECESPQRPESDWEKEYDKKFFTRLLGRNIKTSEMKTYIARIAEAEYQRGFTDGFNDDGNSIHRSNLQLQNARLSTINKLLQATLREGNRAILKEVLWVLPHDMRLIESQRDEGWQDCLDSVKEAIEYLLSFQQEPQDNS